ncbi:MAG: hypothetical protein R3232_00425 [Clostridia bacterium]|nr:hypothetical protein [Clostridia bacterium]
MYGKKAIYFNYKTYGGFVVFMLIPALLILAGLSMAAFLFVAWQPALIGICAGILLAFPGYPRLLAINANNDLKSDKYKKALKKTRRAVRLPFAPISVKAFNSYVLLLNGMIKEADDELKKIKDREKSYSEKAKCDAIKALLIWVETGKADEALSYLTGEGINDADEAISYVKGKLMNTMDDKAAARKHNETAYEMYGGNRDILSNLIISYCRTGQTRDAKLLFRTLYHDLGTTVDALYYMAKVKEAESKYKDGAEFVDAALEIENSPIDLSTKDELVSYKSKLEAMADEI